MPIALLSVFDKTGIVELGRGLADRGFDLVSTGGTAQALAAAGLEVTNVSDLTGFPEMLDGRVKTLHPAVHGGILARRDHPADLQAIAGLGIQPIDIVVVNLYPFLQTARREGVAFDDLVEQIDIGGPSMVRAAAKNFRDVLVVVDPDDYASVLSAIGGGPDLAFRSRLMSKAFAHTAGYDQAIAATLATIEVQGDRIERPAVRAGAPPPALRIALSKVRDLRYGENPHQPAAWYGASDNAAAAGPAAGGFGAAATILQGKELSYTNLLDLDAAARLLIEFDEPTAVVIKHTNPCGMATGDSAADAYLRARDADSVAAFGGIVGLNRPIDAAAAAAIVSTFIEAVLAPSVDQSALPVLARKPKMRVVTADFAPVRSAGTPGTSLELRTILGGTLAQERDQVTEAWQPWTADRLPEGLRVVSKRLPTEQEWTALRFAWRVCAHVKSNAVIFTAADRTIAIGAGQTSRVDAVRVAVMKAGAAALEGSVAASDAFFPFRDGVDAIARAGATAVIHPGGSVRDDEAIAAANENGMAMVVTGRRHFRH
ncbi:MAG: bifunctional phosphoribosylaminoimidazolecarboxamide formyltransferase/IMP cyclohydrolase [Acidobacteriota bacterium]